MGNNNRCCAAEDVGRSRRVIIVLLNRNSESIETFAQHDVVARQARGAIYTGEVSSPDVRGLAEKVAPSIASGGSIALLVAVGICCLLAAVAPFIFAVRSGDPFTIVVSIVALILCFILLTASRTVIDVVLAAIVYFTSAFISVIVYSTDRIVMAITRGRTPPP